MMKSKEMSKSKIIIYGTGSLAEYVGYVFTHDSPYEVAGYCVENQYLPKDTTTQFGLPIYSYEQITDTCPCEEYLLFIAVGNNMVRERLYLDSKSKGYAFANYISSKTTIWDNLKVGENVFIGEGSIIQPFVSIGNNAIFFNTNIAHHSQLGNHLLLSSCTLGGNVIVNDYTFIGMNSTINQNVVIGYHNIIGSGCIIPKNTEDDSVYSNSSTIKRTISAKQIGNKYLH